ncbi:MAG: hypothetical protein WC694_03060 [Candidatus Paceibacterota bacterium]|jgi:hypothetical protein
MIKKDLEFKEVEVYGTISESLRKVVANLRCHFSLSPWIIIAAIVGLAVFFGVNLFFYGD